MKRIFRFLYKSTIVFVVFSVIWVLLYKFVPVSHTPLMAIRKAQGSDFYEKKHVWMPIEEMSSKIQLAAICAEDQRFMDHYGFDMDAIEKAMKSNKNGGNLKGGSTISQQTAKNVFLWPQRSWVRKGFETWFTFLIETFWSKERILEVYLNSIEMGDGVYGAEAAAQHWFSKSASNLSKEEAAAIAAIFPNPREYKANPRTAYIENRKKWIVRQMGNYGTLALK